MQKNSETNASKKLKDSPIFWMILSVFIALLIWVYYGSNYGTEMTRTFTGVEVTYVGRDAMRDALSLIISREDTTSVSLTLTGSRRDIAKLSSEDLKAVVNLSTVTSAGYRAMTYTVAYPNTVNSANIREVKLPQTVSLQISKLSSRIVDVRGRFEGTLQEGYTLDSAGMSFDPAYITLIGPEEELEQVDCAYVVVARDNTSSSFTAAANYNLVDSAGNTLSFDDVTADVDTVAVTVPINVTKEVTLGVSLLEGGGATIENVIADINPRTITLAGDAATLDAINTIYVATVDLSDFTSFPTTEYPIVLPNGTDNISGVTTATVDITFTGLEWAYYTVTNVEYTNLAEGYSAEIMDNSLVVMIRAPQDILSEIQANNIRAVADLTGVTTTSKVPVYIYVDGYPQAGAVGDPAVYVRVVEGSLPGPGNPPPASESVDMPTETEAVTAAGEDQG